MTTGDPFVVSIDSWRECYRAALRETDSRKLPIYIAQAESAIIQRSRELFAAPGENDEEGQAMDDALYALRALRNCLKLNPRDSAVA